MPIKPKQAKLFPYCTNTEYTENSAKMYGLSTKFSGGIYKIYNKNGGVKKMVKNISSDTTNSHDIYCIGVNADVSFSLNFQQKPEEFRLFRQKETAFSWKQKGSKCF